MMGLRCGTFAGILIATVAIGPIAAADEKTPTAPIDYATAIRPLLEEHCTACHGVDMQESGLRLDAGTLAIRGGDRGTAVVAGKADESLLYQALLGKGDVARMPMDADPLTAEQIALVKRWIDEGAKIPADEVVAAAKVTSDHWAFQPVKRPVPPRAKRADWIQNPIDAFVLARLEKEGLAPSPEADQTTLIRRLSLDLRGLPPSLEEVEEFLADDRPGAYERLVDRMLASSQFGERWGRHWLDVARYADSHGFTIDGARSIWKYRDWVIAAFNENMPFDRFTIEQLAGDLLVAEASSKGDLDPLIATGFHRNTLINQEGGTDAEQFRVEAIVDRVNTTGTAFLGLTVGCAQCHQHKYDPISQREYFELYAIFNNCDEPQLPVPTAEQEAALKAVETALAAAQKPLREFDAAKLKSMAAWEESLRSPAGGEMWTILDPQEMKGEKGSVLGKQDDQSIYVDFSTPPTDTFVVTAETDLESITAIRLEALTNSSLPQNGPGRSDNGNFVLSEFEVLAAPKTDGDAIEPTALKWLKAVADHAQDGYPIANAIDGKANTGWAINVKTGSLNVNREAVFFPVEPIANEAGTRLVVRLRHEHSEPNYLLGSFRLSVSGASVESLTTPASIRALLAIEPAKRTKQQQAQLEAAYLETDLARKPLADKVAELTREKERLTKEIPTTMIVRERAKPRETFIHVRGDFLRNGARVTGGVPAVLPPLPEGIERPTRLDFARWLVDPSNPLTARVTVNRFWQHLFGTGLVLTENDFGLQGTPPTHPELLDWLASEFAGISDGGLGIADSKPADRTGSVSSSNPKSAIRNPKWDVKRLLKLIVMSATYRQSSIVNDELLERDPANRLLARQSRLRLEAEVIRDVCLASSGLLSEKVGGPGVYPPQPEGIYALTQVKKAWPESKGADRYRRGMYTFFWRSSPYPLLPTFDAPDANTSCTRRPRSNTPLQALTLANDVAFVEIAEALARRILAEASASDEGRIDYGFRLCFARAPSEREIARLREFLADERETAKDETAAWTALARVLMNVDEFITRE